MPDNLRTHQRFIAILLPPLVPLAALAAGRIRANVTQGMRAGWVHTLATRRGETGWCGLG